MNPKEIIRKGSKSFFLASLVFDRSTRSACWDLYQWCRSCDDFVDGAPHRGAAQFAWSHLRSQWESSEKGRHGSESFARVFSLKDRYSIPSRYFLDLLEGFRWDAEGARFIDVRDVEAYSYYVAGVVGIKMAFIMGVRDPKAFRHAVDLGIALQLTNIARDVLEDWGKDRVYLPEQWLEEAGLLSADLSESRFHPALHQIVLRLLDRGDRYYRSGYEGLVYLPFRAALAVSIAGSVYSRIGRKIRRRGAESLSQRTVVGWAEKFVCVLEGSWRVLTLWPSRRKRLSKLTLEPT